MLTSLALTAATILAPPGQCVQLLDEGTRAVHCNLAPLSTIVVTYAALTNQRVVVAEDHCSQRYTLEWYDGSPDMLEDLMKISPLTKEAGADGVIRVTCGTKRKSSGNGRERDEESICDRAGGSPCERNSRVPTGINPF